MSYHPAMHPASGTSSPRPTGLLSAAIHGALAAALAVGSSCSPGQSAPPRESAPAVVSNLPVNLALRWSVSGVFGGETFEIESDGSAHYRPSTGPRQDWPSRPAADASVTPAELRQLEEELAAAGCCGLESAREQGQMDETRPSLSLRLGGLDCTVELWSREWQEVPQAQACLKPILALRDRTMGAAEPPDANPKPAPRGCREILLDLDQAIVASPNGCAKDGDCACYGQMWREDSCAEVVHRGALPRIEELAKEALAAGCEYPKPCPELECRAHCRLRSGFDGYCAQLDRCMELSEEFEKVLAGGPGKCKKPADCAAYRAGVGQNCGGVTDKATAAKLARISDEFFAKDCDYTVNCAPRGAFHAECLSGTCAQIFE